MNPPKRLHHPGRWLLLAMLVVTAAIYCTGLSGSWLFDDYPNIVDNKGVQPDSASLGDLVGAALSSPSSRFKRPLASLTFAANYLVGGLDPWGWKLVNLIIHLLNGCLVFVLARQILRACGHADPPAAGAAVGRDGDHGQTEHLVRGQRPLLQGYGNPGILAALIAGAWMLLPINLTGVLYVVQRMESLANLFVLLGLVGYMAGRQRMLGLQEPVIVKPSPSRGGLGEDGSARSGLILCLISLTIPTFLGLLAKETAIMLPFYAFLIEWIVFGFRRPAGSIGSSQPLPDPSGPTGRSSVHEPVARNPHISHPLQSKGGHVASPLAGRGRLRGGFDRRLIALYVLILALPLVLGLIWLLPHVLNPAAWARRDFTLTTRLLSEARIVTDYVGWTLFPLPHWLSFYHDNFKVSTGLLSPWTTLPSLLVIIALVVSAYALRKRMPLVSLGIALFLGCHLLTASILPLELIYEHRNYFASIGLLIAVVPLLANTAWPMRPARGALLAALFVWWAGLTLATSVAWGDRIHLAQELAARAPDSPRAQYELGRTYIIYSHYDPDSIFTPKVYPPLERAAALPEASILPEQALIFFNARMHRPIKDAWWDSIDRKLRSQSPGVQDVSSIGALTRCARDGNCDLPQDRMLDMFHAAMDHPGTPARLMTMYSDYAWNVLKDYKLGLKWAEKTSARDPAEPVYHITLARMYVVMGEPDKAREQIRALERLNYGGRLNGSIASLQKLLQR